MANKPTYEELEQRVKELEKKVADHRQIEEILIQTKEEWESTFNAVPDLIAIIDGKHLIVRVNKAMADKLGISPDEAVGLTCYEHVHGAEEPLPFCPHTKLLSDNQEHIAEVHEERLGGDFLVSVTPLHDVNGRLMGCVHVARDITERKKAEDEREKLINELQEALKEIKTLRGILPFCSFCKKIRDDKGYWEQVDVYIHKYSEADISHGICPECMKKNYPEEYQSFLDENE